MASTVIQSVPSLLVNLQLLRFVAALMVVVFHASGHYYNQTGEQGWLWVTRTFGFTGVDIFFVISGFIMWHTNRGDRTPAAAVRFLYHRLARIYLGYWPFFGMAVLSFVLFNPHKLDEFRLLTSFFLLPQGGARPLQVSWTLTFELYFYALFFVLLFFRQRLRVLVTVFLVVLAANVYSAVFLNPFSIVGPYWRLPFAVRFAMAPWLLEFLCGSFVAVICERHHRLPWQALAAGFGLFVAGSVLNVSVFDMRIDEPFNEAWRVAIFGPASALVVYGLVALERSGFRILPRFSELGGGASYAMYLCHPVFLVFSTWTGTTRGLGRAQVSSDAFLMGFCLLVSLFCMAWYRIVEAPLYRGAKRLL